MPVGQRQQVKRVGERTRKSSLDTSLCLTSLAPIEGKAGDGQTFQNRIVWNIGALHMSDPSAQSQRTERVLRARMAAHALHAKVSDPKAHTAPARAVFLSRFEREVDPEGILTPEERARRAEHAKKAYFLKLALASAKARKKGR